jgi:hypothetical protein
LSNVWDGIKSVAGNVWEGIKNAIVNPIKGIIEWLDNAINKAKELVGMKPGVSSANSGGGGAGFYAHGGVIPGAYGQAVPIVAHGGERVIPTSGIDVNGGGTTSGSNINITFTGAVNMDSEARVNDLAQKIIRMIGRQNELARYGLG